MHRSPWFAASLCLLLISLGAGGVGCSPRNVSGTPPAPLLTRDDLNGRWIGNTPGGDLYMLEIEPDGAGRYSIVGRFGHAVGGPITKLALHARTFRATLGNPDTELPPGESRFAYRPIVPDVLTGNVYGGVPLIEINERMAQSRSSSPEPVRFTLRRSELVEETLSAGERLLSYE